MKKLFTLLLALLIMCGCARTQTNEITDLLDSGYEHYLSCVSEDEFGMIVYNEKDNSYKKINASMNKDKYSEYTDIDIFDETQSDKLRRFYLNLEDITVEDLVVPDSSEFAKYKTVGDLENDGYENMGYVEWDGNWLLYYSNSIYELEATLTSDMKFEYFDDLSKEERQALVIDHVEFAGFGGGLIDQ